MTPDRKAIPPHLQRRLNGVTPSPASTSSTTIETPATPASSVNNERALVLSTAKTEDKPSTPTPSTKPLPVPTSLKVFSDFPPTGTPLTVPQHNFSPTEMIQHEVIATLRAQVEQLTVRCDGLEEENAQLRQTVEELALQSNGSAMRGQRAQNLVGYESSDDGTPEDVSKSDVSTEYANQIAAILSNHEDRLVNLEASLTAKKITHSQGVNGASRGNADHGPAAAEQASITERLDSLEHTFETTQRQVNEHHLELQDLQDWRNQVENREDKDESKAIVKTTTPAAPQYDADFQARTERRFEQELSIDATISRDELFSKYQEICSLIEHPRTDGNFHGTEDELWSLRERIIMSIATFDMREKVLEEAREYMKYNG